MKKPVKREFSAGGVVYKKLKIKKLALRDSFGMEKLKTLWLIIQPRTSDKESWRKGRWQLPKGWIDEGESSQQAALREVKEEGGVEAEIVDKIDRINIFFYDEKKQKVLKNVVFFLMRCKKGSEKNHGWEIKEAVWLPYKEAYEKLTFDSEKKILAKAKEVLEERERQQKLL